MLKVNLSDGRTLHYDLTQKRDAVSWSSLAQDYEFQSKITAITILCGGVTYSLPRPNWCDATLDAELVLPDLENKIKGGERLTCTTGSLSVGIMVHSSQRAARVDLSKRSVAIIER